MYFRVHSHWGGRVQALVLGQCRGRRKGSALKKNLSDALQADGVACRLPAGPGSQYGNPGFMKFPRNYES